MKKLSLAFLLLFGFGFAACNQTPEATAILTEISPTETTEGRTTETPYQDPQTPDKELPETYTPINLIQGASHISPLLGEEVQDVLGIVTVISGTGFYMQSPVPDGNIATSEGIFIYNPGLQKVKPGDLILVSGEIEENYPGGGNGELSVTQLVYAEYEILSSENPLPEPVVIGESGRLAPTEIIDDDNFSSFDPKTDGLDFYESLESMLIQINNPYAVAGINKYRELAVVPDNGKNASGFSSRGVLTISENDYNPERLLVDDALRSLPDDIPMGSTTQDPIIGVVDYTFGMFKIQPVAKPKFIYADLSQEVVDDFDSNHLTIAAYNVENLDGGDKDERFEILADDIVNNLRNPHILIMSEVQDNDGAINSNTTEADQTAQRLINAILSIGGPQYAYTDVAPKDDTDGGEGGGNIRVGFLYRTDTDLRLIEKSGGDAATPVELSIVNGAVELSASPARIEPQNSAFSASRKPLIAQFEWQGKKFFVIGMHMNSKGGDDPLFGENQPPYLESENQRRKQAQVIRKFLDDLFALDYEALVVLGGDLNDFQFSPPLQILEGENMKNLIFELPAEERYTYIYEGNAQALDHLFISNALSESLTCFDIVHLNSEFSAQNRFSDHDPVFSCFNLNQQ